METNKNICEKCGKELKTRIRGRDAILYCDEHGDMLVTTYFNEYESDHTKYDVILLPGNECNINNIKLIAKLTNTNSVNAKKLLASCNEEVIFRNYHSNINTEDASIIREVANKLKEANIEFKITPDFPHKI